MTSSNDTVVVIITRSLKLCKVTCSQLMSRGVDLVCYLGYEETGIKLGSSVARGMSIEARARGGGVLSMREGGLTAALQSVGATGVINEFVRETIARELRRWGLLADGGILVAPDADGPLVLVEMPAYFSSRTSIRRPPQLVAAYRPGGVQLPRGWSHAGSVRSPGMHLRAHRRHVRGAQDRTHREYRGVQRAQDVRGSSGDGRGEFAAASTGPTDRRMASPARTQERALRRFEHEVPAPLHKGS